jgi:hypothetical protein
MVTALSNHVDLECSAVVGSCGARRKFGLRKFRVNSTINPECGHVIQSIEISKYDSSNSVSQSRFWHKAL